MLKKTLSALAIATLALSAHAADVLKVAATAVPHAELLNFVKPQLKAQGVDLQVREFSDYVQPNAALAAGDLDANSYQHKPYLDAQVADRGYKLVSVGYTVNFPIGLYSKKVKKLEDLKEGAKFGIPNDPTNGGRVLLVLQDKGLIKLRDGAGLKATPLDVVSNPKKLKFVELDAAQIPRSLDDTDLACVNTNYAIPAGLNPQKDSILVESKDSPYANILAIRKGDDKRPELQKLDKALTSPEVKKFIEEKYKGAVVPAF